MVISESIPYISTGTKFAPDDKKAADRSLLRSVKPMVTDITDVLPMVTNVYPMVAKEASVANPHHIKLQKLMKNQKNGKNGLATLLLPMNYPIPRYYWCHR
jgi:hypothetical protein